MGPLSEKAKGRRYGATFGTDVAKGPYGLAERGADAVKSFRAAVLHGI